MANSLAFGPEFPVVHCANAGNDAREAINGIRRYTRPTLT
jgi:hypothetical protein